MADSKTLSPAQEMEDLIAAARKTEHNFVMMKTKDGVVIEASKTKSCEALTPAAKAKGGMAAMSVAGVMKVEGKIINMRSADEEVPRNLPRLAKRHLKNLGVKFKVLVHLPGGGVIDGDEEGEDGEGGEGEGEEQKVSEGIVAPAEPEAPAGDAEGLRAALMERMRALVPQVKAAAEKGAAGAEKLTAAVKAAAAEIANAGFERAGKLLDAVESGLKGAGGGSASAPPTTSDGDQRKQLESDFKALGGDLQRLLKEGADPVAGKARQLAQMFASEIAKDLAKARQVLGVLRTFVSTEVGKLAKPTAPQEPQEAEGLGDILGGIIEGGKQIIGSVGEKVGEGLDTLKQVGEKVVETVVEGVTKVKEGVEDFVQGVMASPQEKSDIAMLDDLGVPREERNKLLEEWKNDPSKAKAYKTKLMEDAKVPEDRRDGLLKLQSTSPKSFLAALDALKKMEADGAVDASPGGVQDAIEKAETARKEVEAKLKLLAEANKAATEAIDKAAEAQKALDSAKETARLAADAVKNYEIPMGTLRSLPPEDQRAYQQGMVKIINANEEAKKKLAEAEKAAETAAKESEKKQGEATKAFGAHADAEKAHAPLAAAEEKARAKKGLLDATTFGPLGADGKPPMKDEDRVALMGLYGTDARLADQAIAAAQGSKDPSAVAQNAAFVAGKFKDGFADPSGKKLDLPPDQLRGMAGNALRMGAEMGPDYFKGFEEYLKSGKQLEPDPHGGLAAPDPDPAKETTRKKNIAQARVRDLSANALGDDGTVNFGSDKAKGAMDHMLFHPGSLNVFTPQLNLKTAETAALFSDPATKDKAQETIKGTKMPGPSTLQKPTSQVTAKDIVSRSVGKPANALNDNDARSSVLMAMMTPLSQGPVGSCFSTAPVRSIRETDPMRAMDEYSKIASTGMFKPNGRPPVPANKRAHEGENPLLRSWEYSVATAAANEENSVQRKRLNKGFFRNDDSANNLNAVKGIMGSTNQEWNGYNDPVSGDLVEGLKSKLEGAMTRNLKFEYNATAPGAGGGGDGHSTEGRYVLKYGSKQIDTVDDFKDAVKAIALSVTGETETSVKGAQIVTLVTGAPFITSVENALGGASKYLPWKLSSGGFEYSAKKALDGGTPEREDVLGKVTPPAPSRTDRTSSILTSVMGKHGDMPGDMHIIGTSGTNAGHAFNALPKHPSMDKIRDPDSDEKIQKELVEPGQKIASSKMPADRAAKLFLEQIDDMMADADEALRGELVKATKKVPKTEMTPSEVADAVKDALSGAKGVVAQKRADKYVADEEPTANNARKTVILNFYKDQFDKEILAASRGKAMKELQPPEVVVADSNWGGADEQVYFVAAPDPLTGDLVMWKKRMPGGKMELLGQNWEDGPWSWVKE